MLAADIMNLTTHEQTLLPVEVTRRLGSPILSRPESNVLCSHTEPEEWEEPRGYTQLTLLLEI